MIFIIFYSVHRVRSKSWKILCLIRKTKRSFLSENRLVLIFHLLEYTSLSDRARLICKTWRGSTRSSKVSSWILNVELVSRESRGKRSCNRHRRRRRLRPHRSQFRFRFRSRFRSRSCGLYNWSECFRLKLIPVNYWIGKALETIKIHFEYIL